LEEDSVFPVSFSAFTDSFLSDFSADFLLSEFSDFFAVVSFFSAVFSDLVL
jgi:hypothetical protein